MARIAILSLVFPPDAVSTAQIMGNLAVDLRAFGHDIEVMTTTPHYNQDLEAEARQPLHRYWGRLLQKSHLGGIPVYHVLMPRKGTSIAKRLLPWAGFHLLSTLAGVLLLSRPDVIIVPSPPLTIGVSAWLLGALLRAPFVYNVQEIYPDVAVSLGVIRNRWLTRFLHRLESFVYNRAAAITVIAPRMSEQLISKGVPARKVHVIPNFVDTEELQPGTKVNDFSRQYGVHDKFLVTYAGNMGPGQDLETFIEAATLLQNERHIHFMMMGGGMLQAELEQKVSERALANFTFLPHQPYSLVTQIYAASDLNLVPQAPGITDVAVPSKVYRIMACGRPVLASTFPNSDLARLVEEACCGLVTRAGAPQSLAGTILETARQPDRLRAMGEAGRQHVVVHYSRQTVARRYHELVRRIVSAGGPKP
jgi:colanic acid biosynthesis glycosyl transferase WcaI